MAKTERVQGAPDVAEVTTETPTDFPDWATRPPSESEVDVWRPESENQWRRKLSGPELMKWVSDNARDSAGFDEASIRDLFANVANSVTMDDLFSGAEATKGRTILDVMLRIDNIRFVPGQFEDGCPYFVVLYVVRTDTNAKDVVSFGGWRAIAQAAQMHYLCTRLPEGSPYLVDPSTEGAVEPWSYPLHTRIRQSAPTARGFHVNFFAHPMSQ